MQPADKTPEREELAYDLARAIIANLAPQEQALMEATIIADRQARLAGKNDVIEESEDYKSD